MSSGQAKGASKSSGTSLSTKQVHPVTLSSFAPTGCELSTWAYLTLPRPANTNLDESTNQLPNLVTAHANSLKVFVVDPISGTLILASTYENLAGTITTLHALPNASGINTNDAQSQSSKKSSSKPARSSSGGESYDGLLLGFSGQPRMSMVYPPGGLETSSQWSGVLTASSIIDLTPALIERSLGSVIPLEQDLTCSITEDGKIPTVAVVLGGGVSIATFQLPRSNYKNESCKQAWWRTASEPYFLPLSKLSASVNLSRSTNTAVSHNKYQRQSHGQNQNVAKISHGFGDILSCAFLRGYTEPVLVVLHSNPHRHGGRACPGRLGHHSSSTRTPLCLTAISISIVQQRSVVIWSLPDAMPSDAFECKPHPKGGVLVMGVNEVLYVDCAGKVQCCTAVNGWVRSTGSAMLLPTSGTIGGIMQPNPSPLPKLGIQLDGCSLCFVNENVAMLALRDGTLYSLELHEKDNCVGVGGSEVMCMSLSPVGKKLGGLGMISTLSALPLVKVKTMRQEFGKFLGKTGLNAKKEEMDAEAHVEKGEKDKWKEDESSTLGLVFAGSRMGDSTLMVFSLKENAKLVPLERDQEHEKAIADAVEMSGQKSKRKRGVDDDDDDDNVGIKKEKLEDNIDESTSNHDNESNAVAAVSDDEMILSEEEILKREEAVLYARDLHCEGDDANSIAPIHKGSNAGDETLLPGITSKQLYRPQIRSMSVFQHTQVIDSLTGLGPIGPGCSGPTPGKESKDVSSLITNVTRKPGKVSQNNIHTCGFGSSGGLAVLNTPGLNASSSILSEIDCLDIGAAFPCTNMGYVFVVKKGENAGCIVMKIANESEHQALGEVDIDSLAEKSVEGESPIPSFQSVRDILTRMEIISVKEFKAGVDKSTKCIIMTRYGSAYALVILCQEDGRFSIEHSHFIGAHDDEMPIDRENLVSVSFVEHLDRSRVLSVGEDLSLSCVWSSGHSSIFTISYQESWIFKELLFAKEVSDKNDKDEDIDFYKSSRITAVDIFAVADSIFESTKDIVKDEGKRRVESTAADEAHEGLKFDVDDIELYGEEEIGKMTNAPKQSDDDDVAQCEETSRMAPSRYNTLGGYISGAGLSDSSKVVVAITRQSGDLEMYDVAKLFSAFGESMVQILSDSEAKLAALLWRSKSGCGQGASILNTSIVSSKRPKTQESCTAEMRFFFCGPANSGVAENLAILRSLCLLIETNKGDTHLYSASKSHLSGTISFKRVSLNSVSRPSKDEGKHRNKLRRKGMAKESSETALRPNRLHRFFSISGQDGLFAATSHPMWYLSERGTPTVLCHRLRHAAPAGGADVPIAGFCAGFVLKKGDTDNGFITVHDRIGRVGSQRLTLFTGLSDVFTTHGILPGGGISIEKVPLGVTIRQIEFVDDPTVSTAAHPVYALLVSREIDVDQSHLNDDGLTPEQRKEIKDEKDKKKMAKQVEADLGGFDVDQEWVEEIEREECFEIEKRYGGSPPISQSKFEVWIMDSSNWQILDTYQLNEDEYGMSMKIMTLSDISMETAGNNEEEEDEAEIHDDVPFLALGTGIVDQDGEDVCSKGRILLFQLRRVGDRTAKFELELNFVYDKEITIGPVTSVNCLVSEGSSRLVIGAGAEITLEQWGDNKLVQVGFYHCYMQVQDIIIFKNFLLLSDAYDSLHFLVYRESDKSLTLLAKDYEPTSMYAAGLLSRGGTLSFVSHDDRQNLTFLSYAPRDVAARGGNKLVCRADCHLGTQTTSLGTHFCRSNLIINSATTDSTLVALKRQDPSYGKLDDDKRFGLHYGSIDGGFGTILPMSEGIYWRLAALQSVMSNALESDCSLSHRAWRLYRRAPRRGGCRSNDRKKGVVDGDLVMKYADLSIADQEDLASAIGSTVDLIMDNLLEVGVSSMVV